MTSTGYSYEFLDDNEPRTARNSVAIALRTIASVRDLVPLEAAKGPLSVICSFLTLLQVRLAVILACRFGI